MSRHRARLQRRERVQARRNKDARLAVLAARRRLRASRSTAENTRRLAESNSSFMERATRSLMSVRDGGGTTVGVGDT
jgi:hypothetical protein